MLTGRTTWGPLLAGKMNPLFSTRTKAEQSYRRRLCEREVSFTNPAASAPIAVITDPGNSPLNSLHGALNDHAPQNLWVMSNPPKKPLPGCGDGACTVTGSQPTQHILAQIGHFVEVTANSPAFGKGFNLHYWGPMLNASASRSCPLA